jgi:hypothetical protein
MIRGHECRFRMSRAGQVLQLQEEPVQLGGLNGCKHARSQTN